MDNKALIIKGVDRWQLGYFVAKFEELYGYNEKRYNIESVDETYMVIKIKKMSCIEEFRVLRLLRKMNISYYFGTLKA